MALSVQVECEGVDAERIGEHVEGLSNVADGVRTAKPECVVEMAVDGARVGEPAGTKVSFLVLGVGT